jgi:hypothetical protein
VFQCNQAGDVGLNKSDVQVTRVWRPANTWLERTMLGVTSLAKGKRRAARPPLSHTVGRRADNG